MHTGETYKPILEEALNTVAAELKTIATQDPDTGDWVAIPAGGSSAEADENVAADSVEEWNTRRALMTQLETRFRNIERALKKIANGTFGVCEISGAPIEAERLAANPAARTNLANMDREKELPI